MPQNEAEGRLNLYDDVTPLENTNKISVLVDANPKEKLKEPMSVKLSLEVWKLPMMMLLRVETRIWK